MEFVKGVEAYDTCDLTSVDDRLEKARGQQIEKVGEFILDRECRGPFRVNKSSTVLRNSLSN